MKQKTVRPLVAIVSVVAVFALVLGVVGIGNDNPASVGKTTTEANAILSDILQKQQLNAGQSASNVAVPVTIVDGQSKGNTAGGKWAPVDDAVKVPQNPTPNAAEVNVTQEIVLTSAVTYRTPYTECAINAVFTGPNGEKMTIPGFWDGEQTWKIRFAAPSVGEWKYVVECSNPADTGLHGKTGTLKASAYTGDAENIARGRLRKSDDNTYLTYGDGTPFFWLADTSWAANDKMKLNFSNREEYDSQFKGVIDARASQGYTAYQSTITIGASGMLGSKNEGGDLWLNNNIWVELNPEYFQAIDERIQYTISKGITPVLGLGWSNQLTTENLEDFKRVARYLIARLSSYPIVWFTGGEWNFNGGVGCKDPDNHGRLGYYMHETDPYCNLIAMHGSYAFAPKEGEETLYAVDYFRGQEWFDVVLLEGGHVKGFPEDGTYVDIYEKMENADYTLPWIEAEAKYEDIWEIPTDQTRQIAYMAMMNGSFGYSYGAEGLWQATWNSMDVDQTYGRAPTPWYKALTKRVGSKEMTQFKKIMSSLPWWRMDQENAQVTWSKELDNWRSLCRPYAIATEDQDWVAVYYPCNSIVVNAITYPDPKGVLNGLSADKTYEAYWYNTLTGESTLISAKIQLAKDGSYVLPIPEKADLMAQDWMLIVRAADANTIVREKALSALEETENRVLPLTIGEAILPKMDMNDPNAEVFNFVVAGDNQGDNNIRYYTYDPVTEIYTPANVGSGEAYSWGKNVWSGTGEKAAFITSNNIAAPGENHDLYVEWTAPSDGTIVISSRPAWKEMWQGTEGCIFTLKHNEDELAKFTFDGTTCVSGVYNGTIEVKAGDTIAWQLGKRTTYNVFGIQIEISTEYFFSAAE